MVYSVNGDQYQTGLWDASFQPITDPGDAIYRAHVQLAPHRLNVWGGNVTTATVFAGESYSGGILTLALSHQVVYASSFVSPTPNTLPQSPPEQVTCWQQGGTNIMPMEIGRIKNWYCAQALSGCARMGRARRGLCVAFLDAAWAGTPLYGRRFWIIFAKAAGSSLTQTWIPSNYTGDPDYASPTITDADFYTEFVAIHGPSLPAGHQTIFCHNDSIQIADENNAIEDTISSLGGLSGLAGKLINIDANGVALPGSIELFIGSPLLDDMSIASDQFAAFCCTGEIFLIQPVTPGLCLSGRMTIADRSCFPLAAECVAPRVIFERLLGNSY